MFFEKWFDEGDLVLYSPSHRYLAYDDDFNPYTIENDVYSEVCVFLEYPNKDNLNLCKIFVSGKQKSELVYQSELKILSKKR